MLGEGRSLGEGIHPKFISLRVSRNGIDDEPLNEILKESSVDYLERQFIPVANDDELIGVCLVYLEINEQQGQERRQNQAKDQLNDQLEAHSKREGRRVLNDAAEHRAKRLMVWRKSVAQALKYPPYIILNNRQLDEIAFINPKTLTQLRQIKGIGDKRLRRYGEGILNILKEVADPLTSAPKPTRHFIKRVSR